MNALNNLFNQPRLGVVLLRWTLAILMIFHGWAKVTVCERPSKACCGQGPARRPAYACTSGELVAR